MNGLELICDWALDEGYDASLTPNRNGRQCVNIFMNGLGDIGIYIGINPFKIYVRAEWGFYQDKYTGSLPFDIRAPDFFLRLKEFLPNYEVVSDRD